MLQKLATFTRTNYDASTKVLSKRIYFERKWYSVFKTSPVVVKVLSVQYGMVVSAQWSSDNVVCKVKTKQPNANENADREIFPLVLQRVIIHLVNEIDLSKN